MVRLKKRKKMDQEIYVNMHFNKNHVRSTWSIVQYFMKYPNFLSF